jgi:DeoR/GlpR family transcriptional regulator of sugar metabolism
MNLSSVERQESIIRLIEQHQRISLTQVCETFSISSATARRDLEALAEQGKIQRVHGGAIAARRAPPELPISQRVSDQPQEKQRIGQLAAHLVKNGETIFLGSGTTVLEVAHNLVDRRDLTVITNSLMVVNALAEAPDVTIVNLGGMLRRSEFSFIGHITEQALSEVRADKVIMGIRAIDPEQGLMNAYLPEAMTDRAILNVAREIIIVADHTKCGRASSAFLAPITSISTLITDQKTPSDFVEALQAQGIRVLLA